MYCRILGWALGLACEGGHVDKDDSHTMSLLASRSPLQGAAMSWTNSDDVGM